MSDWKAVSDDSMLDNGQYVRFSTFWVCLSCPSFEEFRQYLESDASVIVKDFGTGPLSDVTCVVSPGPITAGELRGEIQGAIADMNTNRAIPVLTPSVGGIQTLGPGNVFTTPAPQGLPSVGFGAGLFIAGAVAVVVLLIALR